LPGKPGCGLSPARQDLRLIEKIADSSRNKSKSSADEPPSGNQLELVRIIQPFGIQHMPAAFPWLQGDRANSKQNDKQTG
ncbi:MAG: hypothetical protein PVJ25_07625, partial [Desulfuromonadales bacterium]